MPDETTFELASVQFNDDQSITTPVDTFDRIDVRPWPVHQLIASLRVPDSSEIARSAQQENTFGKKLLSLSQARRCLHSFQRQPMRIRGSNRKFNGPTRGRICVVAARCGHDPAVLLRIYAKRTKKADTSAAAVIGTLSEHALGGT